jgi:hypothetical protein
LSAPHCDIPASIYRIDALQSLSGVTALTANIAPIAAPSMASIVTASIGVASTGKASSVATVPAAESVFMTHLLALLSPREANSCAAIGCGAAREMWLPKGFGHDSSSNGWVVLSEKWGESDFRFLSRPEKLVLEN